MTRLAIVALAASGLIFAQTQPPTGAWRRVGDPPPPAPAATPAPAGQGQDPEPVDRSDAYGQQVQTTQRPMSATEPATTPATTPATSRPAYGLPAELILKPGTYVTARIGQALSTDHNRVGDNFTAHLTQPIIADGIVVAERNQTVYGRVAGIEKQSANHPSQIALEITSITLADGTQLPVHSQLINQTGSRTPAGVQAGTVAATTGAGAIIGGAVGWGTGAAIGAGAGAVAGVAGVLLTRNHPTIVYPETPLTFAVNAQAVISTMRAPQAFRFVGPEDFDHPVNAQLSPRPAPRPGYGGAYAAPYGGYGYPAPYPAPYPYPYAYAPYPYYGPAVGVVIGGGWGGGWGYGRWGRWR
jgi:hypothetical protein